MQALPFLESAFGSTAKVRLLRVLASSPDRWFSEADLAKAIRMSPNTVNLSVAQLEGHGFLVRGDRRVKLQSRSPLAPVLQRLVAVEEDAVRRLSEAIRPLLKRGESCVLFGSVARGEATGDSDVDLLLVAADHDRLSALAVSIGQTARSIHPGPYRTLHLTPSELRTRWSSPLVQAARVEGVLLAGVPLEKFL